MEGLFFLCAIVGVVMVIYWAATNDKAGNRGPTTGFFAMRDAVEPPKKAKTARR